MKLFKYFITTVVITSILSSMTLDAVKRKKPHQFEQNKKPRTEDPKPKEKVDIDTALIKQEQKEQRELVLPHTLLRYFLDQHNFNDGIYIIIFDYLNPDNEKEFHQLLKDLIHARGEADSKQMEQLQKIFIHGFCLPPLSPIEHITLPEILKNKAPNESIYLLLGHCNNYDKLLKSHKLGKIYSLAVEHKNLDPTIVDTLKNKFLDTLKDEKKVYQPIIVRGSLCDAALNGHLPVIQLLTLNPSTKDLLFDQSLGMVFAGAFSHLPVMQFLAQNPTTSALLSPDDVGDALKAVSNDGKLSAVQFLIQNPTTKALLTDGYVRSALRYAAMGGHLSVIQAFKTLANSPLLTNEAYCKAIENCQYVIRDRMQFLRL